MFATCSINLVSVPLVNTVLYKVNISFSSARIAELNDILRQKMDHVNEKGYKAIITIVSSCRL